MFVLEIWMILCPLDNCYIDRERIVCAGVHDVVAGPHAAGEGPGGDPARPARPDCRVHGQVWEQFGNSFLPELIDP